MRNFIESLSQRVAAHQSRVCQIVYSEPLKHVEVTLRVLMGMAADQPVESNFFSGILEGLLGRLSIAAPGEENPPTSSKEGAAQLMWASAVVDVVQKTKKRRVRLGSSESSRMPPGLHLNYEEDFLSYQSHQVPGVFTDPLFLPNMVNSVYWSDLQYWLRPHLSQLQPTVPPLQWSQWMTGVALRHLVLL